jgi:pimeloyl-ACP methyl ester carboxylesterase
MKKKTMHKLIFILAVGLMTLKPEISKSETIYLIPGQGGDHRLFQNICIPDHETKVIVLEIPNKGELLPDYARRLSAQIDTTECFSLVGVSFGGMIAVEMAKFLDPEKVIIISSAKSTDEFPYSYKVVKNLRMYKLFNGKSLKKMANIARPIAEPDSREDHDIFSAMINDLDPDYLERAIECVFTWENTEYREDIIHLHGADDRIIPLRNIVNPVVVENGSHMMVLTEGYRIGALINEYLAPN